MVIFLRPCSSDHNKKETHLSSHLTQISNCAKLKVIKLLYVVWMSVASVMYVLNEGWVNACVCVCMWVRLIRDAENKATIIKSACWKPNQIEDGACEDAEGRK